MSLPHVFDSITDQHYLYMFEMENEKGALKVKLGLYSNSHFVAQVYVVDHVDCVVSNQTGMKQILTEIVEIDFDEIAEFLPRTKVQIIQLN